MKVKKKKKRKTQNCIRIIPNILFRQLSEGLVTFLGYRLDLRLKRSTINSLIIRFEYKVKLR